VSLLSLPALLLRHLLNRLARRQVCDEGAMSDSPEKRPSRAETFRAEAEKCRQQAKKAATATAIFIYLDMEADFLEKAKQAELEDGNSDVK
jgi:hypothetical protein